MVLKTCFKEDSVTEIGVDEAGRGSFWGPIMAGAVIIPPESEWTEKQRILFEQLRDSKKISPKKREKIASQIKELVPTHSIGIVDSHEINENGIQWANIESFRRAIHGLPVENVSECRVLIDGVLAIDDWKGEQELIVEGDNLYLAIAASSILAKVGHDHWIKDYCEAHPECNEKYDLLKSNGYGTARHREGIRIYGGHELHRQVYIQRWLPGSTMKPKAKAKGKKVINDLTDQCMIKFE